MFRNMARAVFLTALSLLVMSCSVGSKDTLHTSLAEQAAYDAGLAQPQEECAHGYVKKYYFVKTDTGQIRNPLTKWDCIDKSTADTLVQESEKVTQIVMREM